jgi:hypothetical protein
VFEVVVPKLEPAGLEYDQALPTHLLAKHVREDAYASIGTAFTLDGKTFVSAAHVFGIQFATQYDARRLRGADGEIHHIDRFLAYSTTRDLAVFTLRDPPPTSTPLARGDTPQIGATVHTVGNAQGEGLSVRGGNVASFTPEPVDGAWQFIRYSAPTSPGNSGGPLLDADGRVVGVVVRKNEQENLNYAVPIEELDRLSSTHAQFHSRMAEAESGQRLVGDRQFDVELPADYATLAARAQQRYADAILEHRAAFVEAYRERIFPTAPELRTYLREQGHFYYPAEIVRDAAGAWSTGTPKSTATLEAGPAQNLYVGFSGEYGYLVLERPDDVPLATFIDEPERVMEAVVRLLPINREYAGVTLRVTKLGAPHRREGWTDALGRPWTTTSWRIWGDKLTTLHCTPYPRGLACLFSETGTSHEPILLAYARINAPRWTLSYDGRLKDWVEFLALEPSRRPPFLAGDVRLAGADLAVRLGDLDLATHDEELSPDSLLYAEVELTSLAPPAIGVSGISVVTKLGEGRGRRIDRVVEPLSSASRDWWTEVTTGKAPYDGKVVRDDGYVEVIMVDKISPVTLGTDSGVEARLVRRCWSYTPDTITDRALLQDCAALRGGGAGETPATKRRRR